MRKNEGHGDLVTTFQRTSGHTAHSSTAGLRSLFALVVSGEGSLTLVIIKEGLL